MEASLDDWFLCVITQKHPKARKHNHLRAANLFTSDREQFLFHWTAAASATYSQFPLLPLFFHHFWGLKGKIYLAEGQRETNWTHESLPLHGGGGRRCRGREEVQGGGVSPADIPLNLIHYCVATLLWLHAGNWATAAAQARRS